MYEDVEIVKFYKEDAKGSKAKAILAKRRKLYGQCFECKHEPTSVEFAEKGITCRSKKKCKYEWKRTARADQNV